MFLLPDLKEELYVFWNEISSFRAVSSLRLTGLVGPTLPGADSKTLGISFLFEGYV